MMQTGNFMPPMNPMAQTNPGPFTSTLPQPWFPILPPAPPPSCAFWETTNVSDRLKELRDTIELAKSMEKELEAFIRIKDCEGSMEGEEDGLMLRLSRFLEENRMDLVSQESLSLQAANAIMLKLGAQLEPFRVVTNETTPWEEKSAVVQLGNKMLKSRRNKQWRKRKRKRIAETLVKEREQLDQADQEADEWRAREIAKDIAKRKVEKMKEIAKLKAKEEKKRLESELELVLIVEKLQELRSLRIQKLKKQGHFLPEEDDKFLERVRAAVEEEERQATVAADTDAAKGAIATAEESRKSFQGCGPDSKVVTGDEGGNEDGQDKTTESENRRGSGMVTDKESGNQGSEGQSHGGVYDSVASLPIEFYHYYHGSNTDLGTLVEVRRMWDQYIGPGGSRIPGHWVQPPKPADAIWASYLVQPK
ncbi:U11/U12 small nuclear ribonucleoprotein 59 kDa protein-like isoform X1 [Rhododendron vialii]|uniref:U11/U12 small nuclear ribonucleoprotein 59 kDa protein-like isoform X1 n=1 Tax=Rhododendron vialii TaxID=182163 RepID=UPI00265DC66E|nr:U11/U12 small nuclear ribonucleoprotein 59 kDa protein-like isoform X1 [Rhododendron vialii]